MQTVDPRGAVISVQRDSRFGHPRSVVLGYYQALGAQLFRTDEHGTITVRTDGQSVWIQPYIGEPAMLPAPGADRLAETLTPPSAGPE